MGKFAPPLIRKSKLVLESPKTRDVVEIINSYRDAHLYTKVFLKDLENGLRSSDYFR